MHALKTVLRITRSALCATALLATVLATAAVAQARPPAGLSLSPTSVVLSSPEFRTTITLRNDSDRPMKLQLSADTWTQDEDGRSQFVASADLAFKVSMLANLPVDDVGISVKAAVSDFAVTLGGALVRVALHELMTFGFQNIQRVDRQSQPLIGKHIGHPLVVNARRLHGLHGRQLMIDHVHHDLQHRVDDGGAAG